MSPLSRSQPKMSPLDTATKVLRTCLDALRAKYPVPEGTSEQAHEEALTAAATKSLVMAGLIAATIVASRDRANPGPASAALQRLREASLIGPQIADLGLPDWVLNADVVESEATTLYTLGSWLAQDAGWVELYQHLDADAREPRDPTPTPPDLAAWLVTEALEHLPIDRSVPLRVIDPACGCGELLLACLHALRARGIPVHLAGVDVDPLAVLVTRVRLALARGGDDGFSSVCVRHADSLLALPFERRRQAPRALCEPPEETISVGSYDLVLVAPPFNRPLGAQLKASLRKSPLPTVTARSKLSAPFIASAFHLARPGAIVALHTEREWTKKDVGSKVTEFLARTNLRRVIYLPEHPAGEAVAFFARAEEPSAAPVAVAHRDERSGRLVEDGLIDRAWFSRHPWLGAELKGLLDRIERRECEPLARLARRAGIGAAINPVPADVYFVPADVAERHALPSAEAVDAADVHDWAITPRRRVVVPYSERSSSEPSPRAIERWLRPLEPVLQARKQARRQKWFEFDNYRPDRVNARWRIIVGQRSSLHFALARPGSHLMCTTSAVQISLDDALPEPRVMALLAYLNSSVGRLLVRSHAVPRTEGAQGNIHINATALERVPAPRLQDYERRLGALATRLDRHAHDRAARLTRGLRAALDDCATGADVELVLARALDDDAHLLGRMVWLQEEIDWCIYAALGLVPADLAEPGEEGALAPDRRPFLAARAGGPEGPPPGGDVRRWNMRVAAVRKMTDLHQLEVEACKYDWSESLADQDELDEQVEAYALTHIERALIERVGRSQAAPCPAQEVQAQLEDHAPLRAVLSYLSRRRAAVSTDSLLAGHSVPALPRERFSGSGLSKWRAWRNLWSNGRPWPEKIDEKALKYNREDFQDPRWFQLRGPYDLPMERFLSYPSPANPKLRLYGWSGWPPQERYQALCALGSSAHLDEARHELAPWLAQCVAPAGASGQRRT